MHLFAGIAGIALLVLILWDGFETIILPRRVTRRFRLARFYYRNIWRPCRIVALRISRRNRRESFLSFFGPISLLGLFGVWAAGLIFGFAFLQWSFGSALVATNEAPGFWTDLYMSGTNFSTLGLGDVIPRTQIARFITVAEAGIGLAFLAVVISYLPVLYGAFSQRETNISLLDARAGSPPTAAELLARHTQPQSVAALETFLRAWETWSAQLLESHLSYPVLCYFRSQHNNQSWLAALTTILDASGLLLAYGDGALAWQAKLTFAISRHAIVDIAQVLNCPPRNPPVERLSSADLQKLRQLLVAANLSVCRVECEEKLGELRRMYEPYVEALSDRLLMPVPPWTVAARAADNWRTSAWARISAVAPSPLSDPNEKDHF